MSNKTILRGWSGLAAGIAMVAWAVPAKGAAAEKLAAEMARRSGAPGGVCVFVGGDGKLPVAMAKMGRFVVHCLAPDAADCAALRGAIRARGAYGPVSAAEWHGGTLPYADNLVNLVAVPDFPSAAKRGLTAAELLRALAPLGTAFVGGAGQALAAELRAAGAEDVGTMEAGGGWLHFRKPWPADIDEWTHYLHGADGNPVARDRVVGPPRHFQWTSGPRWMRSHETDSSVTTLVTAGGRLFYVVDEAPISLAGDHDLPDKWALAARDAFNGVSLWKVPIRRWGWREWKPSWFNTRPGDVPLNIQKRLVATRRHVYVTLGYHAPVSQLDARTGEILQTYDTARPAMEVLLHDGTLVLSVLAGEGAKVMAVDAATGKRLWATEKAYAGSTTDYIRWKAMHGASKPAKLDPALNLAADGDAVALIDGDHVVGLDFRTGAQRWRTKFPLVEADLRAGGVRTEGKLWVGTMIVTGGVVLHASPNQLAAIDAKNGTVLWTRPKRYIGHLWYEWKDVFVIDGLAWTWTADLERSRLERSVARKQFSLYPRKAVGYDLRTGEPKREVDLGYIFKTHHHHRCYRDKATLRYILASRRGTEFVDLAEGRHTVHNWVRGTCHVGMMPANGLQYAPPHPCVCYIDEKLNGMTVLAPASAEKVPAGGKPASGRLHRGPAYAGAKPAGDDAVAAPPQSDDWPAFRHDAARTGSTPARLPADLKPLWRVEAGTRVSAPTAAGGRVYVARIDEHHVACLDAATGRTLWEFAAGGRVDSPPTIHRGTVLFGSADGCVYCVRAKDGRLVWRFQAAPTHRLVAADGQLESAWPVHGSVLVLDDVAYFVAGRSSQLDGGLHVYGLDAATGKTIHRTVLAGPDYAVGEGGKLVAAKDRTSPAMMPAGPFGENYNLPMGVLPDILASDGETVTMRTQTFDRALKRTRGKPALSARAGLLDGNYFKRTPWTLGGQYARLIVRGESWAYYVRMFDSLRGLDPTVYFTPGAKGYLLFARDPAGRKEQWSQRIGIRVRAMVLTKDKLYVAGPPDVVDPADPLGAFEARKGGRLAVFDPSEGKQLAEYALPKPPTFNGIAAAEGRLLLTDEGGGVVCFGKR